MWDMQGAGPVHIAHRTVPAAEASTLWPVVENEFASKKQFSVLPGRSHPDGHQMCMRSEWSPMPPVASPKAVRSAQGVGVACPLATFTRRSAASLGLRGERDKATHGDHLVQITRT